MQQKEGLANEGLSLRKKKEYNLEHIRKDQSLRRVCIFQYHRWELGRTRMESGMFIAVVEIK